jgi:hypothetical protein
MRLVASPCLSIEDIKAIKKGLKQREEVISYAIIKEFETFDYLDLKVAEAKSE